MAQLTNFNMHKIKHWIFNTDETEAIGAGKHKSMFKEQVIAAHGWCKGIGAERTLNKPDPGDIVFYYRAGYGFVAHATTSENYAVATTKIFGAKREFVRPINKLKILKDDEAVTAAEVETATGKKTSYRHIVSRIHSEEVVAYLTKRFNKTKTRPAKKKHSESVHGGGFQPDPTKRTRVEKAAVDHVTQLYESKRWEVESVEQEKVGYDLYCTKGNQVACVEVKGTSGSREEFILTANELNKAKTDDDFVLYVVTNALTKPAHKKYSAQRLLGEFELTPLSYLVKPKT